MNAPIVRLYGLIVVLFGVLVFATSWWSVFTSKNLRENTANRRPLLAEERIKRGTIRAADGKVLARSVKIDEERYGRRYPTDELFAHVIGYSFTSIGRSGLEQFRNDPLIGRRTELIGAVDSLLGERGVGDSIRTTLNSKAQQAAVDALKGRKGAVVALDPSNGSVLAMVSQSLLRPQRAQRREQVQGARDRRGELADRQPRHAVGLSAGLDDEGGDRGRGDRLGQVRAGLDGQRQERQEDLRRAAQQLRRRGLRRHHAHRGAHELRQHRLGRGR